MATKEDTIKDFDDFYTYGINSWQPFLTQAEEDYLFYLGKQWQDSEIVDLHDEGRNAYVFNYIQRNINLTVGHEIKNRKGIGCKPVGKNDELIADILNGTMINVNANNDTYDVVTDCFEDGLICGMSLGTLYVDYSKDIVSGDIRLKCDPFQSYIIDPKFTKMDFSDCGYIEKRTFVNEHELKMMQPQVDVKGLPTGAPDQKFNLQSVARNNGGDAVYAYDELWTRTTKQVKAWVDLESGITGEWTGSKEDFELFLFLNPTKRPIKMMKPSVRYRVMVGRQPVYDGDELSGIDDYPQVAYLGIYKPQVDDFKYKLHGMVRPSRDPQENYNKIRSKEDDILKSSLYSSWLVEDGALENPEAAYSSGQGQVISRKRGSSPDAVTRLPNNLGDVAPLVNLSQQLNKDMIELVGLSEEALGTQDAGNTEISATLAKMRVSNSVTVLQRYFSNLEKFQKFVGRKMLRMIQVNYTDRKIAEITEKPKELIEQISQQLRDPKYGKNVIVAEQDLTDTQRNLTYMQAVHAKGVIGDEFPNSVIIDRLPITEKAEVRQAFDQQSQQVQQQQAKITEQEELNKRLINAEIVHKLSLAEQQRETAVSRQALAMQHLANSDADRARAILDNIKAAKEIDSMEEDRLMKSIEFILSLENQRKQGDVINTKVTSAETEKDVVATNQMNKQPQPQPQQQGQVA